jgi:hypothetical protein
MSDTTADLLLKQFSDIAGKLEKLPAVAVQIENLADKQGDLAHALRDAMQTVTTRGDAQEAWIKDLRERVGNLSTELQLLVNRVMQMQSDLAELKNDLGRRVTALEGQVKATFDTQLRLGERVRTVENNAATELLDAHLKESAILKADVAKLIELPLDELVDTLPWFKALKWALLGLGAVLVGWLAKVIIQVIITSGVTP